MIPVLSYDRVVKLLNAAAAGLFAFLLLTTVAMLLYQGGSIHDVAATRYHFFSNFFSDLGRLTTFRGAQQFDIFLLFVVAVAAVALAIVFYFLTLPALFPKQLKLAKWAGGVGVISGLCYLGIAATPWDYFFEIHLFWVRLSFVLFLIAAVLNAILIIREEGYPNKYGVLWIAFSVLMFTYLLLLFAVFKTGDEPQHLKVQATCQKILVYSQIITALVHIWYGRRRIEKKKRSTA